jgi:hypothetical protein
MKPDEGVEKVPRDIAPAMSVVQDRGIVIVEEFSSRWPATSETITVSVRLVGLGSTLDIVRLTVSCWPLQ